MCIWRDLLRPLQHPLQHLLRKPSYSVAEFVSQGTWRWRRLQCLLQHDLLLLLLHGLRLLMQH
jgi:hypothetical protein